MLIAKDFYDRLELLAYSPQRVSSRDVGGCNRLPFGSKLLACALNREALFVQQATNIPDDANITLAVIPTVTPALERAQLTEFLLPIPQHMGFEPTQFSDFAYRKIAFVGNWR